tara:strand:+ start:121 stop:576 length:456 start_codon:yes stop_codon:yes gene_type:complete
MKLLILIFIVFLDLISKYFVSKNLLLNKSYEILNFFNLVNIHNKGISFGLFDKVFSSFFILLIVGVSIIILFYWYFISNKKIEKLGLIFVLAGALGNFIDRLINGYVIDFISIHHRNFYWPAFNIADISISVGVAILIISTYLSYKYSLRE